MEAGREKKNTENKSKLLFRNYIRQKTMEKCP